MPVKRDPEFSYLEVCGVLVFVRENSRDSWPGTGKNVEILALYLGPFLQISLGSCATQTHPGKRGMLSTGTHRPMSLHLLFNDYASDNHAALNYSCAKGEPATGEGTHPRDS